MFGSAEMLLEESFDEKMAMMSMLVAGWAMCGCDFLKVKGMRADVVMEVALSLKEAPREMRMAWSGYGGMLSSLRSFTGKCSEKLATMPRMKRQSLLVQNVEDDLLLRAAWTVSYWCRSDAEVGSALMEIVEKVK